jgi:hypothetical protein
MPSKKETNQVQNAYLKIPKKLLEEVRNPNYDDHLLKLNKHSLVIGSTGSGKTNLLIDFLRRSCKGEGTFGHITICTKMQEPIYNYLESKMPKESCNIFYGIENMPSLDDSYWNNKSTGVNLLIFDDMMAESTKSHDMKILPYFIRGRKKGQGITCWYLSQSYHAVPKKLRLQCSYIFLKKIGSNKDISLILRDQSLGLTRDELLKIYKYALGDEFTNFLTIDLIEDDSKRFRKNWLELLDTDDFRIKEKKSKKRDLESENEEE